jgi:hypothetical protein
MSRKLPLFLGRDYFQNAWVVDDLESAMHRWTATCGVGPFFVLEHVPMQDLTYRGRPATVDCTIALAQAGRTQIELIVQHCDQPSVYRDLVPRGSSAFHHIATFATDYDRELAEYAAQGLGITTTGKFGEMRFAYIDASAAIGCVIELLEESQPVRAHFADIAVAAAGWDGRDPVRPAF